MDLAGSGITNCRRTRDAIAVKMLMADSQARNAVGCTSKAGSTNRRTTAAMRSHAATKWTRRVT